MTSLENYAEQVEVLLLKGHALLGGIPIVREGENAHAKIDRIVVSYSGRETELFGPDGITPYIIKIPIEVTIHLVTRDAAQMDQIVAAVEAAQASGVSAAVSLASAAFPGGVFIRPLDSSERRGDKNARTSSRNFEFVIALEN